MIMATVPKMEKSPVALKNRLEKITTTSSHGLPPGFENSFAWAAHFVAKNGMTLPPDTNEYRSLRNWFCYKLNQWKKGQLGAPNIEKLGEYNLDFSLYEATNTGKGHRLPDAPMIDLMLAWVKKHNTYDLDPTASSALLDWQEKLIYRYISDGPSIRHKSITAFLPGLEFFSWRKPTNPAWSAEFSQWCKSASEYEIAMEGFRPFRGELHPDTPKKWRDFSVLMQSRFKVSNVSDRQRGWMIGVGLTANNTNIRVSEERSQALVDFNGGDSSIAQYGRKDIRLTSMLGALLAIRLLILERTDIEICTELRITLIDVIKLGGMFDAFNFNDFESNNGHSNNLILICRKICLEYEGAFSPNWVLTNSIAEEHNLSLSRKIDLDGLGRFAYLITKTF